MSDEQVRTKWESVRDAWNMWAESEAIADLYREATYPDGSKILTQVYIGPPANINEEASPFAVLEAMSGANYRLMVFIWMASVTEREQEAMRVYDGLYASLGRDGRFGLFHHNDKMYRTITYWR